MSYKIDCLTDNSPYGSNINNIKNLFLKAPSNLKNEKLKCQITIDLYNLYLKAINKPIHAIDIFQKGLKKIFKFYSKKIEKNKVIDSNFSKKKKKKFLQKIIIQNFLLHLIIKIFF